jgi:hypothetical protein
MHLKPNQTMVKSVSGVSKTADCRLDGSEVSDFSLQQELQEVSLAHPVLQGTQGPKRETDMFYLHSPNTP